METMIAQRYVKALASLLDAASLANTKVIFDALADAFETKAFADVIHDPLIDAAVKTELLLAAVEAAQSDAVNNLIRLLAEKGRLPLIPAVAEALRLHLADLEKLYHGKVYSNTAVDAATLETLGRDLGKKLDATVTLSFVEADYDGIKVEVADLGVEVSLSKTRLNAQMIEHILKAI